MDREQSDAQEHGPPEDDARDAPRAADDWGTTAREQRAEEPLDDRLREELPDRESGRRSPAGRLVEDGAGLDDREKDLVADVEEEETAGLTAEEAALRVEESPGGVVDHPDDYVEPEG